MVKKIHRTVEKNIIKITPYKFFDRLNLRHKKLTSLHS